MLLPRILTALAGIPLVIAAIHYGGVFFMAFIVAVIILCLYEYGLILLTAKKPVSRSGLIIFGALITLGALAAPLSASSSADCGLCNISGFFIALTLCGIFFLEMALPNRSIERVANTFLGVILIPWSLAHLINIRLMGPYGEYFVYIIFFTVWTSDTAAYFVGRFLGRTALNKQVSPKKTWEGAIGGVIFGTGAALLCWNLFFPWYITFTQALILGVLISVIGIVSDLAESLIKRSSGVKDSSNILPGHGGILDRFDSFLLSAPVIYYVLLLIIK